MARSFRDPQLSTFFHRVLAHASHFSFQASHAFLCSLQELRDGFDRNTVTSADTRETYVLRYLLSDLHDYHELRNASLLMQSLCERAVIESRRGRVENFRFLDDVALYLSAVVAAFEEPVVDDRQAVLSFVGSIVV